MNAPRPNRTTSPMSSTGSLPEQLCLTCGICCNGVLFKDVQLQPGDDAEALKALGLSLQRRSCKARFAQPCVALAAENRCRIYAERPVRCRDFECALFKAVQAGKLEAAAALCTIRATLGRANEVRRLLRVLGDQDDRTALSLRFKRVQRRLQRSLPDEATAAAFADLSLAVHDLNLRLQREFYQ